MDEIVGIVAINSVELVNAETQDSCIRSVNHMPDEGPEFHPMQVDSALQTLNLELALSKQSEADLLKQLDESNDKMRSMQGHQELELASRTLRYECDLKSRIAEVSAKFSADVGTMADELESMKERCRLQSLELQSGAIVVRSLHAENMALREELRDETSKWKLQEEVIEKLKDRLVEFKVPFPPLPNISLVSRPTEKPLLLSQYRPFS